MISQYISTNTNTILLLFLIINLLFTLFLVNENKNIHSIINKIPFDEIKKYQQFASDKKELEILKWKEQNYIDKINQNEKEITSLKDKVLNLELKFEDNNIKNNNNYSILLEDENKGDFIVSDFDKDMIGLKYPEINYNKIKDDLKKGNLISTFFRFLQQLEIKLIYLEKEINVTKLFTFYTSRTLYLKKRKVKYDDSNTPYITKFYHCSN